MSYRREQPEPVQNYTDAFFAMLGVILFMVFWTIAAVAGYVWVFVTAFGVDWIGRMIMSRLR